MLVRKMSLKEVYKIKIQWLEIKVRLGIVSFLKVIIHKTKNQMDRPIYFKCTTALIIKIR